MLQARVSHPSNTAEQALSLAGKKSFTGNFKYWTGTTFRNTVARSSQVQP